MKKIIHMQDVRNLSLEQDDICYKCGGRTSRIVEIFGKKKRVPVNCKCKKAAYEMQIELDRKKEQQFRLEKLRDYSLMDSKFKNCTFENFKIDRNNEQIYKIGLEYCKDWNRMKKNNVGMLLMGSPGVGKTHLSFCIANELLSQYVPVIAISSIGLINKIFESYDKYGQEGEARIINSLKNADLLILDDLGAEHGKDKTKQIIYSVIDSRIRAEKPMIITSNLTEGQIRQKLKGTDGIDRTYDRLTEVCPTIEVEGKSRRLEEGNKKYDILASLLDK